MLTLSASQGRTRKRLPMPTLQTRAVSAAAAARLLTLSRAKTFKHIHDGRPAVKPLDAHLPVRTRHLDSVPLVMPGAFNAEVQQ